jgi:hypothetical protein
MIKTPKHFACRVQNNETFICKVDQGKPVTTEFTFTNNSGKAVVIESAVAGCGCTKPEYPEAPVPMVKQEL